jgi:plastocyanin
MRNPGIIRAGAGSRRASHRPHRFERESLHQARGSRAGAATAAGLVVVAAAAAACGGGGKPTTPATPTARPTAGTASPAGPSSPASPSSPGATGTVVPVSETEFKIGLSQTTFRAGTYTFTAKNDGQTTHALRIEGSGLTAKTGNLAPGQSANLTVTLHPGRYDLDCPVDDHEALGMKREITVT